MDRYFYIFGVCELSGQTRVIYGKTQIASNHWNNVKSILMCQC